MRRLVDFIRRLLGLGRAAAPEAPPAAARVHMPRSILRQLREMTQPNERRPEPLALLRARYASEEARNVVVGIGAIPFPDSAYVKGPAGANFDTDWLVRIANREIAVNVGLLLVHSHGGRGVPRFSGVDGRTNTQVMAPLAIGVDVTPYGAMVLSDKHATAVVSVKNSLAVAEVIAVPDRLGAFEASA